MVLIALCIIVVNLHLVVNHSDGGNASPIPDNRSENWLMLRNKTHRLDCELRVDNVLLTTTAPGSMISALSSHSNYWTNKDFISFMLKQIMEEKKQEVERVNL